MEIYHKDIYKKLDNFITSKQIPNIIFHGEHGSGKKTIMTNFLEKLYSHVDDYKQYIMYVNCAEGKGIKFIREELKFFAKTNIHNYGGSIVKSIILLNADFLTIDAQSALRRCIELFSNYTRFFMKQQPALLIHMHKLLQFQQYNPKQPIELLLVPKMNEMPLLQSVLKQLHQH